jgi:hypothetical protein
MTNCKNGEQISGCQELRGIGRCLCKGHPEGFCGNKNVLYLDCINVDILLMILCYNFELLVRETG